VQYGTTLVLHHNAHTPTMCSTMPQCPHSNNVQHYTTRPTPQQCAESRRLTAPNCDNHQTPTCSRIHPGQVGRSAATSWPDMHMQFRVHVTPSDGRVMLQHMHDPRARHHTVARKPSNQHQQVQIRAIHALCMTMVVERGVDGGPCKIHLRAITQCAQNRPLQFSMCISGPSKPSAWPRICPGGGGTSRTCKIHIPAITQCAQTIHTTPTTQDQHVQCRAVHAMCGVPPPDCDNHQTPTGFNIHPGQVGKSGSDQLA
jgi:hypothetical protein